MPLPSRLPIPAAWLLAVPLVALASPTPGDYRSCHRLAAAQLQRCLDEAPGTRQGSRCWDQSRQTNQACYREQRLQTTLPTARPHR